MSGWMAEHELDQIREYPVRCLDGICGAARLVEGHEEYGRFFVHRDDNVLRPGLVRKGEFE